jgi:hypothetical protein
VDARTEALEAAPLGKYPGRSASASREERELARFRLHLIKHRSMLKHRVHSTLVNFGRPCPVTDLFGVAALEEPQLLAEEIRKFFRPLRAPRR